MKREHGKMAGREKVLGGMPPALAEAARDAYNAAREDARRVVDSDSPNLAIGQAASFPSYRSDKDFQEEAVKAFLLASESALAQARGDTAGHDGIDRDRALHQAKRAWRAMSRARLFMVEPRRWGMLYTAADRMTEYLAGVETRWTPYEPETPVKKDESEKLFAFYKSDDAKRWPFPAPMPFDAVFFSYGLGLHISALQLVTRINDPRLRDVDVFLLGQLLAHEGDEAFGYTFVMFASPHRGIEVGIITLYEGEEWYQPMSLDPWILTSLVRSINEHKKIVTETMPTLANRMTRKSAEKNSKSALPLPAPYYLVKLEDELIAPEPFRERGAPGAGKLVEWSHRWDVRGHEMIKVARGPMPLDEHTRRDLLRRGYRIYESRALTAEDASRLLKRGVPAPKPDEWIGVKSTWREAFVKGPKDKPYVPAARSGV